MHRQMGQPSLVESLLPEALGNDRLERSGRSSGTDSMREGGYPPLTMVILLLQQWSDTLMEEALDDLFFRRWD